MSTVGPDVEKMAMVSLPKITLTLDFRIDLRAAPWSCVLSPPSRLAKLLMIDSSTDEDPPLTVSPDPMSSDDPLELTTTLTGYINDVRHVTREQKKVAVETSNLYGF